jgi:hypothetical protein
MSKVNGGYFCANLREIKYKFERLSQSIKNAKRQNLPADFLKKYLEMEMQIFQENLVDLLDSVQIDANKMEQGLIRRKEFLEKNNLETKYQLYKKQ